MRRFAIFVILMGLISACVVGAGYFGYQSFLHAPVPTPVTIAEAQATSTLAVTLVQGNEDSRQITKCQGNSCQAQAVPQAVTSGGLFDGQSWYYYDDVESQNTKTTKHILLKTQADTGQTTQLIEQTPLTMPRDLIMSPNGQYVAFWLDNIDQPQEHLTELWVYDVAQGSVRVLAEHLYAPDVRSRVRWNSASTYVSFVVDTGPQTSKVDQLQLATIAVQSPKIQISFKQLDWPSLVDTMQSGLIDISPDGQKLAYVDTHDSQLMQLVVVKGEEQPETTNLQEEIPYMQWLADGSLIYAAADDTGSTLWRSQGAASRFVARQNGQLISARAAGGGDYVATLIKNSNQNNYSLYSVTVKNGLLKQLSTFNRLALPVGILQVQTIDTKPPSQVAGAMSQTSDDELVAFIEKNLPTIVGQSDAKAQRITITTQPATAYVEYQDKQAQAARILLTVYEIANADWVIKAHYTVNGASWQKVEGGGLADPDPARLYEWEPSVSQWILKQDFTSGQGH